MGWRCGRGSERQIGSPAWTGTAHRLARHRVAGDRIDWNIASPRHKADILEVDMLFGDIPAAHSSSTGPVHAEGVAGTATAAVLIALALGVPKVGIQAKNMRRTAESASAALD